MGFRTMSRPKNQRKKIAFRPAVTEATQLEERLEMAVGAVIAGTVTNPKVLEVMPPTQLAPAGVTPAAARTPRSAHRAALAMSSGPLTVRRLRQDYLRQVHAATRSLRAAIRADVAMLRSFGPNPTAQQRADFNASVGGALNATALRLATQASLLPNGTTRLAPAIENQILGSGNRSLATRLANLASTGQLFRANGTLTPALTQLTNQATRQGLNQINSFFQTTPINSLSVNSLGQRIPLQQFIGTQLVNQLGNTLGTLAASFPGAAGAMVFPNGTTTIPTAAQLGAFNSAFNNALNIAAFQLGSALSLFPGNGGNVVAQVVPTLFGATGGPGATGSFGLTGLASPASGVFSPLSTTAFGTPAFNTMLNSTFNSAFQNLVTPISQFFGMNGGTNMVLPTTGLTSPFSSAFLSPTFFGGFNNGFVTGTTPGFMGFGLAPTGFNPAFGTGFNNFVSTFNNGIGLINPVALGSGVTGINTGVVGLGSGVTGIGSGVITGTGGGII